MIVTLESICNTKICLENLGLANKTAEELDATAVKLAAVEMLFRLKDPKDAFMVSYYYTMAARDLRRIKKIIATDKWAKWKSAPMETPKIALQKERNGVAFVTNMFGKKVESFSVDRSGSVVMGVVEKKAIRDVKKELGFLTCEDSYLVFPAEYLRETKEKDVDQSKAVARIYASTIDRRRKLYISRIMSGAAKPYEAQLPAIAARCLKRQMK